MPLLLFILCTNEDNLVIAKGNILISEGNTKFTFIRKAMENLHFSGISVQLPDTINVNLKTKKLIALNGVEFDIMAILIDENRNEVKCKIEASGPNSVILMTPGYSSSHRRYKSLTLVSTRSFYSNRIEWFSTDKF